MSNKKILNKFAVLYLQQYKIWTLCDISDWPKRLEDLYTIHSEKIDKFKANYFPKQITIHGFCENDNIAHSDIDSALNEKFKNKNVTVDSEGSEFYCYTDSETKNALCNFLNDKFPDLNYSVDDNSDEYITPFYNRYDAEKYVEKEKIKIPEIYNITYLTAKLKEFDDKINKINKEREEFLKNIK